MAAETQYRANTGMVEISTANANLDGTGTLGTVLTGGLNGTLIKNIIIKAIGTGTGSTEQGMVRLFIYDGTNTSLFTEIDIPATGQSSTDKTFEFWLPLDFKLESGHVLKASTQKGDAFNVIAEGLSYEYYSTSVRPESTNYTSNTGVSLLITQNTNLDGSGTVATLVTATSGFKGLAINSINLKAITDVTRGMLRIFIQKSGTTTADTFLLTERDLYPVDASATFQSFHSSMAFLSTLQIQTGYKIVASIESISGQKISTVVDAMDFKYPA